MANRDTETPHTELHPRPIMRRGLLLMVLTCLWGGGWAALAPLSGAIIARGVVKVDTNRKTVQHLEGGIVKELRVREGDRVEAGQTLLVLADEQVRATLDLVQGQLHADLAKAARLTAERDEQSEITFPEPLLALASTPKVAKILDEERHVLAAKRQTLSNRITLLRQQTREAEAEIQALHAQRQATAQALAHLEPQMTAYTALEQRKMLAKVELHRVHRLAEEYKARLSQHDASIANVRQRITDMQLQIMTLRHTAVQEAADALTQTLTRIAELEERLRPSRDALQRQQIVAPVRGTVVDLKVFTVGGVIGPGQPLLDLVPDDTPLIIEAHVGVEHIDDLRTGMAADIRLTAYPTRSTPLLLGQVTSISADRLTAPHTGIPYYAVYIQVEQASWAGHSHIRLYPGMPAEVFIKTAERTAVEYLLQPMTNALHRAFREP